MWIPEGEHPGPLPAAADEPDPRELGVPPEAEGKEKFLGILNKYMEIHSTMYYESQRPPKVSIFMKNHRPLPQPEFQQLLHKAKLFTGFGFPHKGPVLLEAIAHGCVFLQSRFSPPCSSLNHEFFPGKPTSREVFSEHPYTENFIGKPHVWTVDNNSEVSEAAIKAIMETQVELYLPYEHTCGGSWSGPTPTSSTRTSVQFPAQPLPRGWGLTEPFILAPSATHLQWAQNTSKVPCDSAEWEMHHLYPVLAQSRQECYLQKEPLLCSCAGSRNKYQQLCPCHDFLTGQVALCQGCL
ncbi:Alpha-1,6-mannosylglycoprotein 6-beta-N-acetylglucosaminyltransferase B [Sciurus carolinensis]|uniref:alpha-1,6-mannosyl-glycoprotein 6-beta-N-acetylglucosaminyltransferase n=1 Tax=Sciurus carolinensis TaxID=30640 RepID=A0AA41MJD5_SCICA|nr:Alpha-1,6-mannosylglycoprotein 6-beta-N-acetylglucosaminyltransferase B [Sciurus carolinensis]